MFLECIIYISIIVSSIFFISHYLMKSRKLLSLESPFSDKILYGVSYGMIGVSIMYIHHILDGNDYFDPRQIAILIPLFYGGWIPALLSSITILAFRALSVTDVFNLFVLACSMILTLGIAQLIMCSNIKRSKQWYMITVLTMIKMYLYLWFLEQPAPFLKANLLRFALSYIIGSIFAYHFKESIRQSNYTMEELKKSKEELQLAETNYRLIAEHSSDIIGVLDGNGSPLYLSPSTKVILGLDMTDFEGKNAFQYVHPEDLPSIHNCWLESLKEQKPSSGAYRYRHADGHWIWIETHYVPVVCEEQVQRVIVTSRDISERKETEELIRNSEKLSVVGELAAGIAHEIRNPLTTLMGFTQMMKTDHSLSKPYVLNLMYEELNRIDQITNELLYLAKPQVQEVKQISINGLLKQLQTLLQPQAMLQNIILSVATEENLPPIQGVENRLKQVCINLVKNGMDAMPKGGEIVIQAIREQGNNLLLSIRDHGIGIPEDRIGKLGQPFYSLKEKGTGLGLTVCKKIIQEHYGSITFHSIVGVGTTVEVRLPVKVVNLVS